MTIKTGEKMYANDMLNLLFFPKGMILMYDGTSWQDNVSLKGWYQCAGQETPYGKTPDLRDKFLMGYNGTRSGGNNSLKLTTNNLPTHNHSLNNMSLTGLTVETAGAHGHTGSSATASDSGAHGHTFSNGSAASAGNHSHTLSNGSAASAGGHSHTVTVHDTNHTLTPAGSADYGAGEYGEYHSATYTTSSAGAHTHTVSGSISETGSHTHTVSGSVSDVAAHTHTITVGISEGGSHTHTVNSSNSTISGSVSDAGSGAAFDNRPSYYALIYIIKMTAAGE